MSCAAKSPRPAIRDLCTQTRTFTAVLHHSWVFPWWQLHFTQAAHEYTSLLPCYAQAEKTTFAASTRPRLNATLRCSAAVPLPYTHPSSPVPIIPLPGISLSDSASRHVEQGF